MPFDNSIKVAFCVAYDWNLLHYSLPLIYDQADTICLSIDKDRISWSGKAFSWNENEFKSLIEGIDKSKKIIIHEENFHLPSLTPMQNEVRQRNRMAEVLGEGGWHIQLDTDEFLLDFKSFVIFLKRYTSSSLVNIVCPNINLYKQDNDGFYYVNPKKFSEVEYIQIATRFPRYEYGRRNGYFNVHTSFPILHKSWARSEAEISEKLNNWGHSIDFDIEKAFSLWKNLNIRNYRQYKNFHHLRPEAWPRLGFLPATTIDEMFLKLETFKIPVSRIELLIHNSIWISRIRSIVKKYLGI